jgi:two-component system phosphate regulon response regulator PhoB
MNSIQEKPAANSKPMVLVAIPNEDQQRLVYECLEKAGYRILVTGLGQGAFQMILDQRPDLAVLDWNLPDLNTLALIRRVRSDANTARLPIIIRGANIRDDRLLLGLEAGADLCLKEPFYPDVFVARVRALLRRCAV